MMRPLDFVFVLILLSSAAAVPSGNVGNDSLSASIGVPSFQNIDSNQTVSSSPSSSPSTVATSTSNESIETRDLPRRKHQSAGDADENYENIRIAPKYRQEFAKQMGITDNPWNFLVNRLPCECRDGVCGCCTGMFITSWRQFGCMNITYVPEDFAFDFKMIMNNAVLYENRVTGRNPPPVCVRPPRFSFVRVCAEFHDLYFVGRNMHVCLDMSASFQDYELFNRSFNCMRFGDKGVKVVKPEDGGGFHKPGVDADIDAGYDPIEDYDENVGR